MTITVSRNTVYLLLAAVVLGWWLGSSPASPINPHPVPDRPVLTAFVRLAKIAAKLGLWAALAAEQPPEERQQLVQTRRVDAEGHPVIDHAEGW